MPEESTQEIIAREQRAAIQHYGSPARLLAGPGTGKTTVLVERVVHLIRDRGVLPTSILLITFTRAAAQELRGRIQRALGEDQVPPQVATLHSYALRQLVRNADRFTTLPRPIRIADDWEQRWIVERDLARAMASNIEETRKRFRDLSSDWETLRADEEDWEQRFADPAFLGQWRRHRSIYGYSLRSELVYQLKRALIQHGDFRLDGIPVHLLVDEYQDLNPCDLAIMDWLAANGSELYAAGDDDQSIYGFRNAFPFGIRRFPQDHEGVADLRLTVCQRCDTEVLNLASFIIGLDTRRVPKELVPEDGRPPGIAVLGRFDDQYEEARSIASKCVELIGEGYERKDILILLRQDRNRAFSRVLIQALEEAGLPAHLDAGDPGPTGLPGGRKLLALLRLCVDESDSLAWRTLMSLDNNNLGEVAVQAIEEASADALVRFADSLLANLEEDRFANRSSRIRQYVDDVLTEARQIAEDFDLSDVNPDVRTSALLDRLDALKPSHRFAADEAGAFADAVAELADDALVSEARSLEQLIRERGASQADEELVLSDTEVNILTMHKAKGLGAKAVFLVAAEDEYLPGGVTSQSELDDARRLLYVAATRARQKLFISYCEHRTGQQMHTGTAAGQSARTLSQFLVDGPLSAGVGFG